MPRFRVDVKAFLSVEVDAESTEQARERADAFVDHLSPTAQEQLDYGEEFGFAIDASGGFAVDGTSEVEEAD